MRQYKSLAFLLCLSVVMLAHVTEGHFRLGRREMQIKKARENAGAPSVAELPRRVNREERMLGRLEDILTNYEKRLRAGRQAIGHSTEDLEDRTRQ